MSDAKWKVVGGPRSYTQGDEGEAISVGWAWDIEPVGGGTSRVVRVEVAAGGGPATAFTTALRASGKPLVVDYLSRADPPARILVTSAGVKTS